MEWNEIMGRYSRLEQHRDKIEELLDIGINLKAAWRILNNTLPKEGKVSYSAFYHYINNGFKKYHQPTVVDIQVQTKKDIIKAIEKNFNGNSKKEKLEFISNVIEVLL